MEKVNCLKVDLDLRDKKKVIRQLTNDLIFLQDIKILFVYQIKKIELILKKSFSIKIYLTKKIKPTSAIILQAILRDDNKRVGINFRDLLISTKLKKPITWNRLFTFKKYANNEVIIASVEDITEIILNKIEKKFKKKK